MPIPGPFQPNAFVISTFCFLQKYKIPEKLANKSKNLKKKTSQN